MNNTIFLAETSYFFCKMDQCRYSLSRTRRWQCSLATIGIRTTPTCLQTFKGSVIKLIKPLLSSRIFDICRANGLMIVPRLLYTNSFFLKDSFSMRQNISTNHPLAYAYHSAIRKVGYKQCSCTCPSTHPSLNESENDQKIIAIKHKY